MGRLRVSAYAILVTLGACISLAQSPAMAATNPPGLDTGIRGQTVLFSINGNLYWYETNLGDYDQDGIVDIMDLTPLGQHYGKTHPLGKFFIADLLAAVDGDGNGEINSGDITTIGQNFGNSVLGGYKVYASTDPSSYPENGIGPNGPGARLMGEGAIEDRTSVGGNRTRQYWHFHVPSGEQNKNSVFWVRPVDESGKEGMASTMTGFNFGVVPYGPENAPVLQLDLSSGKLKWYHQLIGDYDQNGEVNVSDLTANAIHAFKPGPYSFESIESVDDGNLDGQIDEADHVVLAHYFMYRIDAYAVYRSTSLDDYPAAPDAANGDGSESVGTYPTYQVSWPNEDFFGNILSDRIWYEQEVTAESETYYYWVRPLMQQPEQAIGIASNWVEVPAAQ